MTDPKLTIVVPTRNRARLLSAMVESILEQDLGDFEVVVIDDGSDEETLELYGQGGALRDERVKLVTHGRPNIPNAGPAVSRNRGLALARGRFVCFADDDDRYTARDHFSVALDVLETHRGDLFIADQVLVLNGEIARKSWYGEHAEQLRCRPIDGRRNVYEMTHKQYYGLLTHRCPHVNVTVFRTELLRSMDGYWKRIEFPEDVCTMLRYGDRAKAIFCRTEPVAEFLLTPHPRVFTNLEELERLAMVVGTMQYVRCKVSRPEARRCARRIESWSLVCAAGLMGKAGAQGEAWRLLAQAGCARMGWSVAKQAVALVRDAVSGKR